MTPASPSRPAHSKINWMLIIGACIVSFTVLLAIAGPLLAPQDPMRENYSLKTSTGIHSPPYRVLEVPGYPLGTDDFGRDMLSRILFGIRPTLTMVVIVAGIRLLLALAIGMTAGWSSGLTARALEGPISVALALPVLIVSLMCISALRSQQGLWVFIFALSLNGWAESAQLIRDKTHEIKKLSYLEAGRALGASNLRILITHVLRQILPMVWLLMAYEISATLLVTAELGFLGYYIGGGIWVELFDFQAVNITGLPELGQILATSVKKLTEPAILIITGSVIFLTILGFNLLGDGLRREITVHHTDRQIANPFLERITTWFEWYFIPSLETWFKQRAVRYALLLCAVLLLSGTLWWNLRLRDVQVGIANQDVPGSHPWATEFGNAQGTRFVPFKGPAQAAILWQVRPADSILAGPALAADGSIYVVAQSSLLFAYDAQGKPLWQAALPAVPVGSPALGPQGQIYVVDHSGGLSAFASDGKPLWHYAPPGGRAGTGGPIVGKDGVTYYTRLDNVQAVSPSGQSLWYTYASDSVLDIPPRLSPAEDLILIKNGLINTKDGSARKTDLFAKLDPDNFYTDPSFFIGANDSLYYRVGHGAFRWDLENDKFVVGKNITWDARNPEVAFPSDAGVNAHGLLWMLYGDYYSLVEMVWLDINTGNTYGINSLNYPSGNFIGIDVEDTVYICGYKGKPHCLAIKPGQKDPVWESILPDGQARLEESSDQIWGALSLGRLYVTTRDGYLYALGAAPPGLP